MKDQKITTASQFIRNLTGNKMSIPEINRAVIFLRAKKIVFYDNWTKDHVLIVDKLLENKKLVIEALTYSLQYRD